jgi:hypothetical protein
MPKKNLTALLEDEQQAKPAQPAHKRSKKAATAAADATEHATTPARFVRQPGMVNVSAYFTKEVKTALRQCQVKTDKNIKALMGDALAMLFRSHNVPVPQEITKAERS